ncbi:glycerol-3-phosphate dehydrogenase subunit B [Arcanobacterium wilhelmae]|uniref:Glycerol-3-phosphate dehydrogenase subunit B n=1 Tax=Arcanobacterium wilhelmae TaxID=1803177 RepID=A0ABT9NA37_9ACTO|nr:glycerol-3-phosphate dehydrogenase subunit GlpB [Arcanobacterium wilhelmae]MDP9800587.1 glycerol-3-phosphate dehydrogenase subunit B [Arcanobacterium wilhelmae]WFN89999.1 glycerol-3-phosphate dehydrogenase subunit GlpB [Arcanobacterium wilhelmae]
MKVVVIGAGLAAMASALMAAEAGHRVTIVTKGIGGLGLSTGVLDVYSWAPDGSPVSDPFDFSSLPPEHPYHAIGADAVRDGVAWLEEHVGLFGARPVGAPERNMWIPTPAGAVRPAYAVQRSMADSVLRDGGQYLVVGFRQFKDFPAQLIADNLARSPHVRVTARAVTLDLAARSGEADSNATAFARAFDGRSREVRESGFYTEFGEQVASALAAAVRPGEVVLLPAFCGLKHDATAPLRAAIADAGGAGLAEMMIPPPSVAGRRIYDALLAQCREARIDVHMNATVTASSGENGRITRLLVSRAGRETPLEVDAVIDAAGRFESGNIMRNSRKEFRETIFGLPLAVGENPWTTGVVVDSAMHPTNELGSPIYANLHLAGDVIAGSAPWAEKSGEGIALGSARAATNALGKD